MNAAATHAYQWQFRPLIEDSSQLELPAHDAVHLAAQVFPCIFNYLKPHYNGGDGKALPAELMHQASEDAVRAVMAMVTAVRSSETIYKDENLTQPQEAREFRAKEWKLLAEVVKPLLGADFTFQSPNFATELRNECVPLQNYLRSIGTDSLLTQNLRARRKNPKKECEQEERRQRFREKVFTDFFKVKRGKETVQSIRTPGCYTGIFVDNSNHETILERYVEGISGKEIANIHEELTKWIESYREEMTRFSTSKAGKSSAQKKIAKAHGESGCG